MSELEDFQVQHNQISGQLPVELFNLPKISFFDVQFCGLSGTLSESFNQINETLRDLILNNNGFSGPIPRAFDDMGNLSEYRSLF